MLASDCRTWSSASTPSHLSCISFYVPVSHCFPLCVSLHVCLFVSFCPCISLFVLSFAPLYIFRWGSPYTVLLMRLSTLPVTGACSDGTNSPFITGYQALFGRNKQPLYYRLPGPVRTVKTVTGGQIRGSKRLVFRSKLLDA